MSLVLILLDKVTIDSEFSVLLGADSSSKLRDAHDYFASYLPLNINIDSDLLYSKFVEQVGSKLNSLLTKETYVNDLILCDPLIDNDLFDVSCLAIEYINWISLKKFSLNIL